MLFRSEKVTQTYAPNNVSAPVTVTATVSDTRPLENKVKVTYIHGDQNFIETGNAALIGQDSGASWFIDKFSTFDIDVDGFDNSENKYYEDMGDLLIDFNEGNPFGEFGNMGDAF